MFPTEIIENRYIYHLLDVSRVCVDRRCVSAVHYVMSNVHYSPPPSTLPLMLKLIIFQWQLLIKLFVWRISDYQWMRGILFLLRRVQKSDQIFGFCLLYRNMSLDKQQNSSVIVVIILISSDPAKIVTQRHFLSNFVSRKMSAFYWPNYNLNIFWFCVALKLFFCHWKTFRKCPKTRSFPLCI